MSLTKYFLITLLLISAASATIEGPVINPVTGFAHGYYFENDYDNEVLGGVTLTCTNSPTFHNGSVDGSYYVNFSGAANNKYCVNSTAAFVSNANLSANSGFSIAYWALKTDNTSSSQMGAYLVSGSSGAFSGGLGIKETNSPWAPYGDFYDAQSSIPKSTIVPGASWFSVVLTYDKTDIKIYHNGVLQQSLTNTYTGASRCGAYSSVGVYSYCGALASVYNNSMDNLFIYYRPLNTTEVAAFSNISLWRTYYYFVNVTAINNDTNASISSFSVVFNGTKYNTTNGTITLPLYDNDANLWSLNYTSNGFNFSYYENLNLTAGHVGVLVPLVTPVIEFEGLAQVFNYWGLVAFLYGIMLLCLLMGLKMDVVAGIGVIHGVLSTIYLISNFYPFIIYLPMLLLTGLSITLLMSGRGR